MTRFNRFIETLFVILCLAVAALIVEYQVNKIARRIDAQLKAKAVAMEVQKGGWRK
jgi:hypothetical protein